MLAGFLFVYGLLKNSDWHIKTLTCIDYETLYNEEVAKNEQLRVVIAEVLAREEHENALIAELRAKIRGLINEPVRKNPRI